MLGLRNIEKRFASQTALSQVNLEIKAGEFFSLLGPSGCGKSTLLRLIAGLEPHDAGTIEWRGLSLSGVPAQKRPFNMVFQRYALFPHLSVFENVAFGLRLKRIASSALRREVKETLSLVGLEGFETRLPETLSGGQAQRVALARALVNKPEVLLLDEPLSALDQKMRERMQGELRALQRKLGLTFIFVTHDQEEAIVLSDRIAVMNHGRIEQIGSPQELYSSPRSIFTARFIGHMNEFEGSVARSKAHDDSMISIAPGPVLEPQSEPRVTLKGRAVSPLTEFETGVPVRAFVRPEHLKLILPQTPSSPHLNRLEGELLQIVFRGTRSEALVSLPGGRVFRGSLDTTASLEAGFKTGDMVALEFNPLDTHVFAAWQNAPQNLAQSSAAQ